MIDVETLMNDKQLLIQERDELKAKCAAQSMLLNDTRDELAKAWDQVYALTSEVNRLTELVTAAQVK